MTQFVTLLIATGPLFANAEYNECDSPTNNCHVNAICRDAVQKRQEIPGIHPGVFIPSFFQKKGPGFECTCANGYTGTGIECADINECDENDPTHNCHVNAVCTNHDGSFECACVDGYNGNGIECTKPEIVECTDYTECSSTCGSGTKTCQRTCKNGKFGDVGCPTDEQVNTQTCNTQACPEIVECFDFTECSVTCGNGTQTCERTCENGQFGDVGCPNELLINTQACNTQDCPHIVDCTDYNECSVTCGSGTQTCMRTCENGNFGDVGCPNDEEINEQTCNPQDCPQIVDCSDYTECSATCGNGTQTCNRTCVNGNFGDVGCPSEEEINTLTCNTNKCPVIVDCDDYSECSVTCGNGTQTCVRTCENGNFGDAGCPNDLLVNTQTCNSQQCPEIMDCSDFSECSATCGSGTQTCSRTCENGNFGDVGCSHDLQLNIQTCNSQACPEIVDCFDYTECSATCGNGTQTCNRTCKNGSFGDVGCPNDQQVNSQTCNSQACPIIVDCSDHTECSVTCGTGTQTCTRTCDNGNFGDVGCPHDQLINTLMCNIQECPKIVDCADYNECSVTCGSGSHTCTRTCENGNFGDAGCPTELQINTQTCNSQECPVIVDCSDYSTCSVSCGSGTQTCQRTCENGNFGDVGCPQDQQVNTQLCNPQQCPEIVDCSDYNECSVTCGSGTQTCSRTCDNGSFGDVGCSNELEINTQTCNPQECPEIVECSDYNECSVTCGGGTQSCSRTCANGNFGEIGCSSDMEINTQTCNPQACPEVVDCADYSDCSATCGSGTQTCSRTCANGNFGEVGCSSDMEINTQTCNPQACPKLIGCADFTECSLPCGNGTQTCTRTCQNGNFGDDGCSSDLQLHEQECNTEACPFFGTWAKIWLSIGIPVFIIGLIIVIVLCTRKSTRRVDTEMKTLNTT